MMIDVRKHNRNAWNQEVDRENEWTKPVSSETIELARSGKWHIVLTPTKPVPPSWFPELKNLDVLCLASGGGQQAPILAAAGANVTLLDNSPKQLDQDRFVAKRDGLAIRCVEGDMADLSCFADASFHLIVHPVSNCFVPNVLVVWQEAYRVLRSGGALLSGFTNPIVYLFDEALEREGILSVRHKIPYSDLTNLTEQELAHYIKTQEPLNFGHTLEDQIGGQLKAGFLLADLYEDYWPKTELAKYMPTFIATRAVKR